LKDLPLISIITPAYNAAAYIAETIVSVQLQTYSNWELIIVDDGSSDNTSQIIKAYADLDKRIFYYYQTNGKQGKARNLAISKSKGEYLAFLDADDLWMPEKLAVQLDEIKETKADLVFSSMGFIDEKSIPITNFEYISYSGFLFGEEGLNIMLELNRIPILSVLVKKSIIWNVAIFSEEIEVQNVEDYHLWLQLIVNENKLYGSEKTLALYRVLNESASNSKSIEKKIAFEKRIMGVRIYFAEKCNLKIKNQITCNFKFIKLKILYTNKCLKINFFKAFIDFNISNRDFKKTLKTTYWLYKKIILSYRN
jgi:glycosyltransferase involved in cell wall biosynthesis